MKYNLFYGLHRVITDCIDQCSQLPGCGPVPGPGINYTGLREA
jgi:hypothetical protein